MTNPQTRFEIALEGFRAAADEILKAHFAREGYTFATPGVIVQKGGKRYAKLVSVETSGTQTVQRGVHSFVDRETGDIFKPASYNRPAKHVRGSIYTNDGRGSMTDSASVKYLR